MAPKFWPVLSCPRSHTRSMPGKPPATDANQAKKKGSRDYFAKSAPDRFNDHYYNRRKAMHGNMARAKACLDVDSGLLMLGKTGAYTWTSGGNHLSELMRSWAAYERKRRELNDKTLEFE